VEIILNRFPYPLLSDLRRRFLRPGLNLPKKFTGFPQEETAVATNGLASLIADAVKDIACLLL